MDLVEAFRKKETLLQRIVTHVGHIVHGLGKCDEELIREMKAGVKYVQLTLCLNDSTKVNNIEDSCIILNKILMNKSAPVWNFRINGNSNCDCDFQTALITDWFLLTQGQICVLNDKFTVDRTAKYIQQCKQTPELPPNRTRNSIEEITLKALDGIEDKDNHRSLTENTAHFQYD